MSSSQITDQVEQSTTKTTETQSPAASYTAFECLGAPSGLTLTRQEINRLILEYLVVEGYKDAAEKFSKEIGISQPLSEIHSTGASLAERMEIREAVLSRRIEETIDKVNQLWPELFEKNPYIYFQVGFLHMLWNESLYILPQAFYSRKCSNLVWYILTLENCFKNCNGNFASTFFPWVGKLLQFD